LTSPDPDPLRLRSRFAWRFGIPAINGVARAAWRMSIDRGPGFPPPPFVIAANHYSFLDPPLVGAVYRRRVRFIGLVDLLGHHRFMDWAMDAFEVIQVRRGTVPLGTIRASLAHLEAGGVIALFPEGRRVERFGDLEPRPGAAWLAVRAGVPLVPVAMTGTDQVLGIDNKLRRGRVGVIVGPPLHPEGMGREAVADLTRRWVAWMEETVARSGRLR
jgi:1-acyl-sn-glycerol-3-phosphate acyltransferase